MPRSARPRRAYDADRALRGRRAQLDRMRAADAAMQAGQSQPVAPAVAARRAAGHGSRAAWILGGTAAVGGGVAYGLHRHRRTRQGVSKMIDPTTGQPFADEVSKRFKVAVPVPSSTRLKAAVPTGRHVSHANDLHVTHHDASPRDGRLRHISKGAGVAKRYDESALLKTGRTRGKYQDAGSRGRRMK